ncbi:hypothetical protein [Peterkaempfera sp. SMS 1(5)a]
MRKRIIGLIAAVLLAAGIGVTAGASSAWAGCGGSYANAAGEIVPCR